MNRPSTALPFALPLTLSLALLLGACASKAPRSADTPTESTAAEATESTTPATPPVAVPARAARKVVLVMSGPPNVTSSKDWPDFKAEWKATFGDYAREAGIAFSVADGVARPQGEDGTLLDVQINDYRMVGIGARIMFGIMTGNAYINARVRLRDLRDGTLFGEQVHNTTSSAWGGIAARVTPQQVDAIGADVFKDIKAAR